MNIIEGCNCLAMQNIALTNFSPSPTYLCSKIISNMIITKLTYFDVNDDALILKNVEFDS